MIINIPREVERALNILHINGFEAYIVGGCVRDSILGLSPSDWDITTPARPEEILLCFSNHKTIETGMKHGTITVILGKMQIEITSYRIDGEYSDKRHPDDVSFTDRLDLDLKRRDFTVNALAYNKNGIIDLFAGIEDIGDKIIRCVGDPDERFNEDGLRILRALRFASALNFDIESYTSESINKNKQLLNNISRERINAEFNKLIMGNNYQRIMMKYRSIIEVFLPELGILTCEELKYRLNSMKSLKSLTLRLSVLFYKVNNPETILIKLKYDNATVKSVKLLTSYLDEQICPDAVNIKKWLHKINYVNLNNLIKIKKALFMAEHESLSEAEATMNEIIETNQCYTLKELAVNGQDLINSGIPKGKDIGRILNETLNKVIEGKIANNKDSLLKDILKGENRKLLQ